MKKLQLFDQNHGVTPLQKCQFCGFLKATFLMFRKACLLYKTSQIVSSGVILTIYDMGIRGFQRVTGGYRGLQRVTRGYQGLQGVTWGDKGLQGVAMDYRNFFLTRTFPDTFPQSILHKNPSLKKSQIFVKTMDQPLWKNSEFAFFVHSCLYSL